jgi:hypothetical protein
MRRADRFFVHFDAKALPRPQFRERRVRLQTIEVAGVGSELIRWEAFVRNSDSHARARARACAFMLYPPPILPIIKTTAFNSLRVNRFRVGRRFGNQFIGLPRPPLAFRCCKFDPRSPFKLSASSGEPS